MKAQEHQRLNVRSPVPVIADSPSAIPDDRFRNLVGTQGWNRLPSAIRKRFGKRLQGGDSVAYQGVVTAMRMNRAGHFIAQLARLVGAPLPYDMSSVDRPAVVIVTEDVASDGQFWVRQYGRARGFPQTVHSSKRFAGPTGLEEYIGYGIGMALRVKADGHALLFQSDHFFLQIMGHRFAVPSWLNPGSFEIGHHDLGDHAFAFTLSFKNKVFGEMIAQDAVFRDAKD